MKKSSAAAAHCRRKFLRYFKGGFRDETYFEWERGYKERAHQQWLEVLDPAKFRALLTRPAEIAAHAVRIESRTNLLFSFEKMALRDAVKSTAGATLLAHALYDFLHGRGTMRLVSKTGATLSPACHDARPASSPGRSSPSGASSPNPTAISSLNRW